MKQNVVVLMGGLSAEREVSLESGAGVAEALREKGHQVTPLDWHPGMSLSEALWQAKPDAVWIALHGQYGEDGAVQGLLTCMGLPYTGSGILASALAMDKARCKVVMENAGLPVAPSQQIYDDDGVTLADWLDYPVVVKPSCEGSSVGVSIVKAEADLAPAVDAARRSDATVIVEKFISGPEIAVGILDGEVLGGVEIRPATEFYDYEAKYKRNDTQYLVPPEISKSLLDECQHLAMAAHEAVGCQSYSRVDLIVDSEAGQPYLIEVNTLPGMTSHSLLPKAAAHRGIDYAELCHRILAGAHR